MRSDYYMDSKINKQADEDFKKIDKKIGFKKMIYYKDH